MTKLLISTFVVFTLFTAYFTLSNLIRIGCEGRPKLITISMKYPCAQQAVKTQQVVETRYKLVNVWPATYLLIGASVPLSLIAIGTTLMIRALWKAKWQ